MAGTVEGSTSILRRGRTHQLRVHAASPDGMDAPIVGDTLYGRKAQRLYLHAESLSLVHPVTHEVLSLTCKPDFEPYRKVI